MLASDDANREFTNPRNPDAALQVTFYQRTDPHNFNIRMNAEHKLCGDVEDCVHMKDHLQRKRTFPLPETVTTDYICIEIPGRKDTVIHEPVREDHKTRFPSQWNQFVGHTETAAKAAGTPLEQWSELTGYQVTTLHAERFYTVEQVANCDDNRVNSLGMNGHLLRQKARGFVVQQRDKTSEIKAKAETEAKAKELEDLKAAIPNMIADAIKQAMTQAQLPAAQSPKPRGRPRKVKDGTNAAATGQPSAG